MAKEKQMGGSHGAPMLLSRGASSMGKPWPCSRHAAGQVRHLPSCRWWLPYRVEGLGGSGTETEGSWHQELLTVSGWRCLSIRGMGSDEPATCGEMIPEGSQLGVEEYVAPKQCLLPGDLAGADSSPWWEFKWLKGVDRRLDRKSLQ